MNAFRLPQEVLLPELSAQGFKSLLEKSQDLVLLLDTANVVVGFIQDELFNEIDLHNWIGQNFSDILCNDSIKKLKPLLENDAAKEYTDARWRHVNLQGHDSRVIPVLTKAMSFQGDTFVKAIFCRDLRATEKQINKFIEMQQQFEVVNQSLRNKLSEKELQLLQNEQVNEKKLLLSIHNTSYKEVIKESVANLERQCLKALLKEANGNKQLAAKLSGLQMDELQEKIKLYQVQ
jgi:transcriptional regulator with PAS, ATPase and Fis domain